VLAVCELAHLEHVAALLEEQILESDGSARDALAILEEHSGLELHLDERILGGIVEQRANLLEVVAAVADGVGLLQDDLHGRLLQSLHLLASLGIDLSAVGHGLLEQLSCALCVGRVHLDLIRGRDRLVELREALVRVLRDQNGQHTLQTTLLAEHVDHALAAVVLHGLEASVAAGREGSLHLLHAARGNGGSVHRAGLLAALHQQRRELDAQVLLDEHLNNTQERNSESSS
jgi:hypothetical protein